MANADRVVIDGVNYGVGNVASVNGQTGDVVLSPADIGAKATQTAKSSPSASGTAVAFIDTITQDAQGVITATKKTVRTATTSQSGLMSSTDKSNLDTALTDITNMKSDVLAVYPAIQGSGNEVTIDGTISAPLRGLTIYGKSVQSSTPTPSDPVTIDTAGSGGTQTIVDIDIRASRGYARNIPTPNGLPGIKVSSGGNYTDANNQQWLCDTIDKATGKYTQRVGVFTLNGSYTPTTVETVGSYTRFWYQVSSTSMTLATGTLCSHLLYDPSGYSQARAGFGIDASYPLNIWAKLPTSMVGSTAASIKAWMQSNPMTLVAALATSAETDLTDSQVIALNLPNSYDGGTTVRSGGSVTPDISVTAAVTVEAYVDYRLSNAN